MVSHASSSTPSGGPEPGSNPLNRRIPISKPLQEMPPPSNSIAVTFSEPAATLPKSFLSHASTSPRFSLPTRPPV